MAKKIRVLVVDDSALMRKHLRELLTETGEFEVTVARDGLDALELLHKIDPDVITLDINMPEMDGLTCLSRIMAERPKPVVMVSSLTEKGAEVTYEALALGAVDYIPKPDGTVSLNLRNSSAQIIAKVRAAAGARVTRVRGLSDRLRSENSRTARSAPVKAARAAEMAEMPDGFPAGLVLIGVSTGGPRVLEEILPELPGGFPWPVLIAQHMPRTFTGTFSRRLNGLCELDVQEVVDRSPLRAGCAYVGRGDADMVIVKRGSDLVAATVPSDAARIWHPSVSRLVETALACIPAERIVGVMLTGMGDDGAEKMAELHSKGGRTIAEDASTAVVFGMPGELVKRGGADEVLPSYQVASRLMKWLPAALPRRSAGRAGV